MVFYTTFRQPIFGCTFVFAFCCLAMLSELAALSVFGCRLSLCRVVFFFKMLCMCCQIDEGVFFICMQIKPLQSWHDFKNVSAEIRIVHLCFINLTQGTFLHLHIVTGICQCLLCVKYNSIYSVSCNIFCTQS